MAGVIDSDYRGDIGVILYNTDKNIDFTVKKGDRIAQIIFEACYTATLNNVDNLDIFFSKTINNRVHLGWMMPAPLELMISAVYCLRCVHFGCEIHVEKVYYRASYSDC